MTVLARRALVLALAVACTSSVPPDDDPAPHSVLFIGNSLTYTNDLPAMVAQVADAAHDAVRVAMAVGGNLAVIDHTNGATDAVAQIDRGGWTFVVLQQGPTPAGVCRDTLVIAAMRLAPHIGAVGARSALFLPWPHQGHPEALRYAGASATLAARAVGGVVLPVGIAWQNAVDADATIPLYGPDGYHPAPAGTLLAALTIYERLFGRDVRDIPTETLARLSIVPLPPERLRLLAESAHAAAASLSPDPPTPAPADTTRGAEGGGPC